MAGAGGCGHARSCGRCAAGVCRRPVGLSGSRGVDFLSGLVRCGGHARAGRVEGGGAIAGFPCICPRLMVGLRSSAQPRSLRRCALDGGARAVCGADGFLSEGRAHRTGRIPILAIAGGANRTPVDRRCAHARSGSRFPPGAPHPCNDPRGYPPPRRGPARGIPRHRNLPPLLGERPPCRDDRTDPLDHALVHRPPTDTHCRRDHPGAFLLRADHRLETGQCAGGRDGGVCPCGTCRRPPPGGPQQPPCRGLLYPSGQYPRAFQPRLPALVQRRCRADSPVRSADLMDRASTRGGSLHSPAHSHRVGAVAFMDGAEDCATCWSGGCRMGWVGGPHPRVFSPCVLFGGSGQHDVRAAGLLRDGRRDALPRVFPAPARGLRPLQPRELAPCHRPARNRRVLCRHPRIVCACPRPSVDQPPRDPHHSGLRLRRRCLHRIPWQGVDGGLRPCPRT